MQKSDFNLIEKHFIDLFLRVVETDFDFVKCLMK